MKKKKKKKNWNIDLIASLKAQKIEYGMMVKKSI